MCAIFYRNGIVEASITPAMVVWIPECKIKYHRKLPISIYIDNFWIFNKFKIIKSTKDINP